MKEDPILRKCCCIFPIRPSLVIFAVFKILADTLGIAFCGYTWMVSIWSSNHGDGFTYSLIIGFALLLDISLMILLVIGAAKKSSYILKIVYYYSIASLLTAGVTAIVILTLVYTGNSLPIRKEFYSGEISVLMNLLIHVAIIFAYILLHIYMIVLMKGEITKMCNTGNYDVRNDESMKLNTERDNEYPYGRYQ